MRFQHNLSNRAKGIVIPRYAVKYCDSTFTPHFFTEKELTSFFNACDQLDDKKFRNKNRALVVPVFFRLLYSSGMRTCEARLLKRKNIDLVTGIITVLQSKGPFDHYVMLDETMLRLMQVYDKEMNTLSPNREYFFPSRNGGHYKTSWESKTFKQLWEISGGAEKARAYDLRHHYAIENINGWMSWNGSDFSANLKYLSKSMGHSSILATLHYYHLVPKYQEQMVQLSGDTFSNIVKELEDE
ncbi:MAG: tyrosine-type recombinase/integrase [Sphaerochaeta sp.]